MPRKLWCSIVFLIIHFPAVLLAAPAITNWSSTGGNPVHKADDRDTMYVVSPNDAITFSVEASEAVTYTWTLNKVVVGQNAATFAFAAPPRDCVASPSDCIWEIHVVASNTNGEDHLEWVLSSLSAAQAPEVLDYFTDKGSTARAQTDPWGRQLPAWNDAFDASAGYARGVIETFFPSRTVYGTWKFRARLGDGSGYITVFPFFKWSSQFFSWGQESGTHHHCVVADRQERCTDNMEYSIEYDAGGISGPRQSEWWDFILIHTEDGWMYMFAKNFAETNWVLDSYVYDPQMNKDYEQFRIDLETTAFYFDGLEIYSKRYLYPRGEGVKRDRYIYLEEANGPTLQPKEKEGIVVRGRNVTLGEIAAAINDESIFEYDMIAKTATAHTNLHIDSGAELLIRDEKLQFHCDGGAPLEFAPGFGSTLRIDGSVVTTDGGCYFVWNFPSGTTYLGYPYALKYFYWAQKGYNERHQPMTIEWGYYGRLLISGSTIENSAHLFLNSPYELSIRDTKFVSTNEIDIGDKNVCDVTSTQQIRDHLGGKKSLFVTTDDLNVKDFTLDHVSFSGSASPLNIRLNLNAHRDKFSFYNLDLPDEVIAVDNPLAEANSQSHTCYVGGSSNRWGNVYTWKSFIANEFGLVNSRFKELLIDPTVRTDLDGRPVGKSVLVKYFLDVLVVDGGGQPVPGANVAVSVEQTIVPEDRQTNHSAVENKVVTHPYSCPGDYTCFYHHYRIEQGQPVLSIVTAADGHTPRPDAGVDTFVLVDFKRALNLNSGAIENENYTYSIHASNDGANASISGVDPDATWFRENEGVPAVTVVCNLGTGTCEAKSECSEGEELTCGSTAGECRTGKRVCRQGRFSDCEGGISPKPELCNGLDDDCDSEADEGLTLPACALALGVCAGKTKTCAGAQGFVECTAERYGADYQSVEARCDGLDNDCNGAVDESCACSPDGSTKACGTSVGECQGGTQRCAAGQWSSCEEAVGPTPEICDGLDNDCDGLVDEELPSCKGDGGPDGSIKGDSCDCGVTGIGSSLSICGVGLLAASLRRRRRRCGWHRR